MIAEEAGRVDDRAALEAEWLHLTRVVLPGLAVERRWPVRADHCFQRILLDAVFSGRWYDHVDGRPAYRHLSDGRLAEAVTGARAVADGSLDLHAMNARSLAWRRGAVPAPPTDAENGRGLPGAG